MDSLDVHVCSMGSYEEKKEQVVIALRMQWHLSEQNCKPQVFIGILSVCNQCPLSKVLPMFWYHSMNACNVCGLAVTLRQENALISTLFLRF